MEVANQDRRAGQVAQEPRSTRRPELLYILGPSYSGSTLLTFLLARHPKIATIGELKATALGDIDVYRCSCGALLKECAFWQRIQAAMQERGAPFSFGEFGTDFNSGPRNFGRAVRAGVRGAVWGALSTLALATVPSWRRRLGNIVVQNRLLIGIISELQGGRVFLDGSKDPDRLRQLALHLDRKVKVIRLIRDGRGVTNSYMKHYKVGMDVALSEWLGTERGCDQVLSELPAGNVLTLQYEELCRNPRETLAAIWRFAGLEAEPEHQRSEVSDFHILGNAMRLDPGKAIALDEKWRKELRADALALFERLAGGRNRQYGYA